MNHREVWFVGLLALAYLYLDVAAPPARREQLAPRPPLPPIDEEPAEEPFTLELVDGCPRDATHPISRRDDGAKWCLSCDEAFYPIGMVNSEW